MTFLTPRQLADQIVSEVAAAFGVSIAQLFSLIRARQRTVARVRMIAQWMLRNVTTMGLGEIGDYFGRDHSTVCHAVRVVNTQLRSDELLRQRVETIARKVGVEVKMPLLAPVVRAAS